MILYNSSLSAWSIVCTEYTGASTFMTCNNELMNIHLCMEISNHEYSLTGIQCIRRVGSLLMIGIIITVKNTVRVCVCAHMHAPPHTHTHTHTRTMNQSKINTQCQITYKINVQPVVTNLYPSTLFCNSCSSFSNCTFSVSRAPSDAFIFLFTCSRSVATSPSESWVCDNAVETDKTDIK